MSLLRMSLAGALLICVIVLLRALALHRLPKTAFLLLWAIALARLLLPYALPSALSVYSLWARLAPAAEGAPAPAALQGFTAVAGTAAAAVPPPAAAPRAGLSIDPWRCAYFAGAAVCALFFAAAYCKCRREFRASLPLENECIDRWRAAHAPRRLSVRQSDRIAAPLTYGVFRPVILLPTDMDWTDEEALAYVLAHELTHIRRFDAVSKLLLTAAVCVHWFNPLAWVMYVLANRDLEISCDEAVIRRAGGKGAAYARALIRMEERKRGFAPLSSSFSRNAIEERIIAIMKLKKTSALAVLAAALLVAGTGVAFATTAAPRAKEPLDQPATSVTTADKLDMLSFTDPVTGETYYSVDGGKSYMTQAEKEALYPDVAVEWWTYEGYKAWLENEKIALQGMLGERGWTGGRGDFVWTQEIIDETIAMYEQTLADIAAGYKVSKTVNGSADTMLFMGTEEIWTANELPPIEEYAPFGLSLNQAENALYYQGEKVRWFEDSADLGDGGQASRCNYYREDGTVSLRTVRQPVANPDGSTDPFGPILRLEKLTASEAEARIKVYLTVDGVTSAVYAIPKEHTDGTEAALKTYAPFGLEYRMNPVTGDLRMSYQGKPVHCVSDSAAGLWIANNLHGSELPDGAIALEAVYETGRLTGLRETPDPCRGILQEATADGGDAEEGTPLPGMFDAYAPYGLRYEETVTADGTERSLYLDGHYVNHFSDLRPGGGVFSFGSTVQRADGIKVRTVYENGVLTGLEKA